MQTLVFNTTEKTVVVYQEHIGSNILFERQNVSTVKVVVNHYEVIQKIDENTTIPVLRIPIGGTNMVIEK
jgi:hypothetical protein